MLMEAEVGETWISELRYRPCIAQTASSHRHAPRRSSNVFDRLKDFISEPGSIQDKLGNLGEQITGSGAIGDQIGDFGGAGAISEQLNGVEFPIGRDDLVAVLEGRGVPSQLTDRLQNLDVTQFASRKDVMGRISGLGR